MEAGKYRDMGKILESVEIFDQLRKQEYQITIENGIVFSLRFRREQYHHLAGFQHLTDLPDIANPKNGSHKFYRDIMTGKIKEQKIESSVNYDQIAERIAAFRKLGEILESGEGKIIVAFDPTIPGSLIEAKFLLFQREGNPFQGDATYYSLFLDSAEQGMPFFPVTFLVEHSGMYVREQKTYFCNITRKLLKQEKHPEKQLAKI